MERETSLVAEELSPLTNTQGSLQWLGLRGHHTAALNSRAALSIPLFQPEGHGNKGQHFSPLVYTRSLKLILLPSADKFLISHLNDVHMQGTVTRSKQNYSTKSLLSVKNVQI